MPPAPRRAAALAFALLLPAAAHAAPLEAGSALPSLELQDQHGAPVALAPTIKRFVFAADMAGANLASAAIGGQPAGLLARQQAVYVADVSRMPGLVLSLVALPQLRQLPFPVALVRDGAATADIPRQPGRVTVLELEQGAVAQVRYAADERELLQALGVARGEPGKKDDAAPATATEPNGAATGAAPEAGIEPAPKGGAAAPGEPATGQR